MDVVKETAAKAADAVDDGLSAAATVAKQTAATTVVAADQAIGQGKQALSQASTALDQQLKYLERKQDEAFTALKHGVEYCLQNPYVGYPAAVGAALLVFPGARRLLYHMTIGRLRNPEAVVRTAQQRLESLGTKVEDYSKQAEKLQARALAAEEEMTRGAGKLKAARSELQRLASSMGKCERTANRVLVDLRTYRQVPNAMELRAEAAQKLATLQQQRAAIQKDVWRIAKHDL